MFYYSKSCWILEVPINIKVSHNWKNDHVSAKELLFLLYKYQTPIIRKVTTD